MTSKLKDMIEFQDSLLRLEFDLKMIKRSGDNLWNHEKYCVSQIDNMMRTLEVFKSYFGYSTKEPGMLNSPTKPDDKRE